MSADKPQSEIAQTVSLDDLHDANERVDANAKPGTGTPSSAPASAGGGLVHGTMFAGRYRVEALLGRGGMGAVYRVLDTLLGEDVALKTLDLGDSPHAGAADRFQRELRLSRKITTPMSFAPTTWACSTRCSI
ncbi:MAG: hypothetical protein U0165_20485 [Polyangiaceae bacterium]